MAMGRVARSEVKTFSDGYKYLDKIDPFKKKDSVALEKDLRKISTLNTSIPEEDYGEHRDYTTPDGSKATFAVRVSAYDNTLVLRTIESVEGRGAGTALMNDMTALADKRGVPVILVVEPFQPTRAGASKKTVGELHAFYSKYGFVLDERTERKRIGERGILMIRPPSKTKP